MAGKEECVKMIVSSIQNIVTQELSDKFVKENYGFNTVFDYYAYVEKK